MKSYIIALKKVIGKM